MLTFFDFPTKHWRHLRTTNVVESPFASVRLRTNAAKRYKKIVAASALIWRTLIDTVDQINRWRPVPHGLALRILGEPSCGDEQPLICDARQRMLIPSPKLASSKITGLFSGSLLSFLQHARQCEQVEENKPGKFG